MGQNKGNLSMGEYRLFVECPRDAYNNTDYDLWFKENRAKVVSMCAGHGERLVMRANSVVLKRLRKGYWETVVDCYEVLALIKALEAEGYGEKA